MAIAKKIPAIVFVATGLILALSTIYLSLAAASNDDIGTFSIAPTSGPTGTAVNVGGDGFGPHNYIVDIYWDPANSNLLVGHTEVANGSFSVSFAVPVNAKQGDHTVQANINDPPCTSGPDTGCGQGQIVTIHKTASFNVTGESRLDDVSNASEGFASSDPSTPSTTASAGITTLPNTGMELYFVYTALALLSVAMFLIRTSSS